MKSEDIKKMLEAIIKDCDSLVDEIDEVQNRATEIVNYMDTLRIEIAKKKDEASLASSQIDFFINTNNIM